MFLLTFGKQTREWGVDAKKIIMYGSLIWFGWLQLSVTSTVCDCWMGRVTVSEKINAKFYTLIALTVNVIQQPYLISGIHDHPLETRKIIRSLSCRYFMLCYRRQSYSQITIMCVTRIPTVYLKNDFVNLSLITNLYLLFSSAGSFFFPVSRPQLPAIILKFSRLVVTTMFTARFNINSFFFLQNVFVCVWSMFSWKKLLFI